MKTGWMSQSQDDVKWGLVVILSVVFHVVVFASILFIPNSYSARRSFDGTVYEVNLVEMPGGGGAKTVGGTPMKKAEAVLKPNTPAKRIEEPPKKEEKPVIIAKKTQQTPPIEKPKESPADLLNKALSKIERKVKTEEHLDKALANLENRAEARKGIGQPGGTEGGGAPGGTAMQIYQMEVESLVKSNWHYPAAMESRKDLEAIVVLAVKRDGTILSTRFDKRSTDAIFDESVEKAIERSNPLPPFPEGYQKSHDELEINFNLKDLPNN